jgi:O-acetylhomoserine/O-acetylserine sulfhydrylase-like pyridoxal-dependent enzyme
MKVAEFLDAHEMVESVNYLGLENHSLHALAKKYLKLVDSDENLYGHLLSFNVKGGLENARRVLNKLHMIFRATDLGRIKSVATIPSVTTHQQQGVEARGLAKIPANMIRLCVGAEDTRDVIDDLRNALSAIR